MSEPKEMATDEQGERRGAIREWLDRLDGDELFSVVSLVALCVLVKVLWLTHIDIYWDAGAKWHFARQWAYANDFGDAQWSHHMARFGVNLPTYLVQRVFGTATSVYYVVPIAMHTLQALFVYLLARHLAGRGAGVLGLLFMTFFTGMTRNASQLLPDGMAGTAALIAGYAFVRFHESEGKARWRWLAASAISCVWTYAIKESSVLLFPGFGVAVLLSRRSFKEALVFSGIIASYALLETGFFRLFTPYSHRLAVVQEEHGWYPPIAFWDLLDRFFKLDPPWQMLFWLWTATLVFDLGSPDRRRRLLVLLPVGYVFFLTFLVRSVNPIQQWLSFKPRYMSPAGGFFATSVAVFAGESLARAWKLLQQPRLEQLSRFLSRHTGPATFALCALLGAWTYATERPHLARHPLVDQRRSASILNDAYRRNLPIVEDAKTPRGLNTAYAVFLQPKYLSQAQLAKPGWLPDIQESVLFTKHGKRYAYILRDGSAYERGDLQRLVKEGCGLVVSTKGRVIVNVDSKLPEHCKAPRGAPIPR